MFYFYLFVLSVINFNYKLNLIQSIFYVTWIVALL